MRKRVISFLISLVLLTGLLSRAVGFAGMFSW